MDKNYIKDRTGKKHIIFRYKTRAFIVGEMIKKYLYAKPIYLLDLGSADGRTLLEINNLIGHGIYTTGIEQSSKFIAMAPKMPNNITIIESDVTSLSKNCKPNCYDVITALAILEHLEDPISVLKEARIVLRNNGILIATCPEPFWDMLATKLKLLKDHQHKQKIGKKKFLSLLQKSGFAILEYKKFMLAPVGFLPYLKIPVTIKFSRLLDNILLRSKIFNWLFINQCIVARKIDA